MATANRIVLLTCFATLLPSGSARASDSPEVDIESLRGELYRTPGEWLLEVRYDIEVEDYHPAETLNLVISVTEHGRVLADADGQPLQYVIPLDQPTDVDHDELEFERAQTLVLPEGSFADPRGLRVYAEVLGPHSDAPLDYKEKSIKFKAPRSAPHDYGVGLAVGYAHTKAIGRTYCRTYGPRIYHYPRASYYTYGKHYYKPRYRSHHFGRGYYKPLYRSHHYGYKHRGSCRWR